MSFDNKEIEVKVAVSEQQFRNVQQTLMGLATCCGTSRQVDSYYTPEGKDFMAERFPYQWLSIRQRGGRTKINSKHFHPEGAERHTHCDEFETEISSPDAMAAILRELGVRALVVVDKTRTNYVLDGFEVALDEVVGLGFFVEVEATRDFGGVEATREQIGVVLRRLGLHESPHDLRGYPYMLYKKA